MNEHCEVISAFLDDEPVDSEELSNALATIEGRGFLIDAIALRRLTRGDDRAAVPTTPTSKVRWRLAVAAALILAAAASFQLGQWQGVTATVKAPEPTRVISGGPAWQEDTRGGGIR